MIDKRKIIKLRNQGLSYQKIGKKLGCSRQYCEKIIHHEKRMEAQKRYLAENKKKITRYRKKYYQKHKEELKEYNKKYRIENKDKLDAYKEKNKQKIRERSKKYYQKNKEKILEKIKIWNKEHPNYQKEYRKRVKELKGDKKDGKNK